MLTATSKTLVYAAILFLPLPFLRLVSNFTVSDALITLAFLTILISGRRKEFFHATVLWKNEFLFPLAIFSTGVLLSLEGSADPIESITAFMQIIFIFMVAYPVLSEVIQNEDQIKRIAVLLIIPSTLLAMLMVLLKVVGINIGIDLLAYEGWRGRMTYGGMEPNIPGRIILQNIPLLVAFAIISKSVKVKSISMFLIMLQLFAVIFTSSRSNFVTFLMALFLFLIFYFQAGRRIKLRYILAPLLLGGLIAFLFYLTNEEFFLKPFERYSTILDVQRSASSMERIRMIDKGFTYLDGNPLTGLGLGNSYLYTGVAIHNPLIISWVENGLLGIIGFAGLYITLIYYVVKAYRLKFFSDVFLIALAIIAVMMVFGDMFMANSYKRVLWMPALLVIIQLKLMIRQKQSLTGAI